MEAPQKELIQCDMCCGKTEKVQTYTCQHKICYKCFYKILLRSYIKDITTNDNINIGCVCKKGKLSLNIEEIYQILVYLNNSIPKNATNEVKEGKTLTCVNHVSLKQLYFCLDCKEDICENCFIEGAEHYQHRVISSKDYIDSLKRNLEHFPNLDMVIAKHENHIKEGFNDYSKKINLIFDKALKEITKYKSKLIEQVKETVQKYETSMKIVNLLFKYFNYEVGHLSNDIHELLFLINTKVILPEINYHYNQTEKDMENIIKMVEKLQVKSLPEIKLNQKLSHFKCVQTIEKAHETPITSLCLLDNLKMASGDEQGNVQIWKMTRKGFTSLKIEKPHNAQIDSIIKLSYGKFMSYGKKEDYLILWKTTSNEIYEKKQRLTIDINKNKEQNCILCVNKMTDNDSIVIYLTSDTFCFYKDKSTNCEYQCESCYHGNSSPISTILVLSDNKILASSPNSKIFIYSCGEIVDTLPGSKEEKNPLVEMDNLQFASGGEDNKILIWGYVDNKYKQINTLSGHLYPVTKIIYLDDGRVITGSKDSFIKIWIKNYKYEYECIMTLREHKEEISGLVNVDDNTVISTSFDKSIKIFLGYKMLI